MKTNSTFFFGTILAVAGVLGLSSGASAQSDSRNAPPAKQSKPTKKPPKVWTEEDLGSLRTPADAYAEAKDRQAGTTVGAQQPEAGNQTLTPRQPQKGVPPPTLTNPKSLEDADKMIAWENRDIAAQEEFLEKVKQEIDEAPADQKERLTKLLKERTQILANTRNELRNLETKKRELARPPAPSVTAATDPPSQ